MTEYTHATDLVWKIGLQGSFWRRREVSSTHLGEFQGKKDRYQGHCRQKRRYWPVNVKHGETKRLYFRGVSISFQFVLLENQRLLVLGGQDVDG